MHSAPQPVLRTRTAAAPPDGGRIDSVEFTVRGMACGACAARIVTALRAGMASSMPA
jgi:hypothetical protein